jgi:hypothetical protein
MPNNLGISPALAHRIGDAAGRGTGRRITRFTHNKGQIAVKKLMTVLAIAAFGLAVGCNEPTGTTKANTPAGTGAGKASETPGAKGATKDTMPKDEGGTPAKPTKAEDKK